MPCASHAAACAAIPRLHHRQATRKRCRSNEANSISTAVLTTCFRGILRNTPLTCDGRRSAPPPPASTIENVLCFGRSDIACNRFRMSWTTSRTVQHERGGYPSLTAALLARRGIDFAAGRHRLSHPGKSGAIACRTPKFSRLDRRLFHSHLQTEKGTKWELPHWSARPRLAIAWLARPRSPKPPTQGRGRAQSSEEAPNGKADQRADPPASAGNLGRTSPANGAGRRILVSGRTRTEPGRHLGRKVRYVSRIILITEFFRQVTPWA
jgi:hypothetical protein